MEDLVFRSVKSIVLFGVMFLSLKYLGVGNEAAVVVSLIPLVLGVLNVMIGAAYSIAALVFILAAFSALLPAKYDNAVDFVTKITNDGVFERGANRADSAGKNDAKKLTDKDNEPIKSK
ncbi:MAG: hypothetical protein ACPL7M_06020 [Bryobacteraceae bacterium]